MDGSPVIRIGDVGPAPSLSPDGKRVLGIAAGGNTMTILPVGAGEARSVKTPGVDVIVSRWFADSRRITVGGHEPGRKDRMFLLDPDTGARRAITPEGVPVTTFGAFDGDRFILADGPDQTFALYSTEGGTPRPARGILPGESLLRPSSDRKTVFVATTRRIPLTIFRVDPETGTRTRWMELAPADRAGVSYVTYVALSAEGSAYAYHYRRWLSDLFVAEGLR